jgi:hypothetical protein
MWLLRRERAEASQPTNMSLDSRTHRTRSKFQRFTLGRLHQKFRFDRQTRIQQLGNFPFGKTENFFLDLGLITDPNKIGKGVVKRRWLLALRDLPKLHTARAAAAAA